MPRKIKVIDLKDDTEMQTEKIPTDYNEVIEILDDKQSEPIEPTQIDSDSSEPVVIKKSRTRTIKPKKTDLEPVVEKQEIEPVVEKQEIEPVVEKQEIEPVVEKQEIEPVVEQQEIEADVKPKKKGVYKTVELVECPKCGKKLTERTLKYSHANKCPKNENAQTDVPSKPKESVEHIEVSKDIEPAVSAYAQRLKKIKEKQQSFKNLATLAF